MKTHQYDDLYKNIFEAISKSGFEAIANVAYDYFKRPVMLIDSDSNLLVQIPKEPTGDFIWDTMIHENAVPPYIVTAFTQDTHLQNSLSNEHAILSDWGMLEKQPRILSTIYVDRIAVGYMAVLCHNGVFYNEDLAAADIVTQAFSISFRNQNKASSELKSLEDVFLADLFQGRLNNRKALAKWQQQLNLHLDPSYCIAAVRPHPFFGDSSLQQYMRRNITNSKENIYSIVLGRTIFMLFSGISDMTSSKQFTEYIKLRISALINQEYFNTGVSSRFSDLMDLGTFQYQAAQSLNLGVAEKKDEKIYLYSDYTVKDIFSKVHDSMARENYLHPALKVLSHYDDLHKTEYVNTLRVYITSMCSTGKTTQEINIHRNTLLYRLDKIEELTEIDLTDMNTCAHLLCSFYLIGFESPD